MGIACKFKDTDYNEEAFFNLPRLLSGSQQPVQVAEGPTCKAEIDGRRLGMAPQRHVPPMIVLSPTQAASLRQGHQPPRRRSAEA